MDPYKLHPKRELELVSIRKKNNANQFRSFKDQTVTSLQNRNIETSSTYRERGTERINMLSDSCMTHFLKTKIVSRRKLQRNRIDTQIISNN